MGESQRHLLLADRDCQGQWPGAFRLYPHVLERIAEADTLEKLEALLPWNAELPASKKVAQYD